MFTKGNRVRTALTTCIARRSLVPPTVERDARWNMLIPIHNKSETHTHPRLPPQLAQFGADELVLIEMQGALEVEGSKDGQLVGKLRIDPATVSAARAYVLSLSCHNHGQKKPSLTIGHHLLEGKLVNFAKPLAVLHRINAHVRDMDGTDYDAMEVDDSEHNMTTSHEHAKSWKVMTVVKRKMVFSQRPMPIVGKTASSAPLSRIASTVR